MPKPDSMDLYFQGMAWVNKGRGPDDWRGARDFFERALASIPTISTRRWEQWPWMCWPLRAIGPTTESSASLRSRRH